MLGCVERLGLRGWGPLSDRGHATRNGAQTNTTDAHAGVVGTNDRRDDGQVFGQREPVHRDFFYKKMMRLYRDRARLRLRSPLLLLTI